jgi:hypothetical protein
MRFKLFLTIAVLFLLGGSFIMLQPLHAQQQEMYTISGQVRDSSGRGVDGIVVSFYDGEVTGTAVTAEGGYYSHMVYTGWIGTVTPDATCYTFSPASASIGPVNSNIEQNFPGIAYTHTISGTVLNSEEAPLVGAAVTLSTGAATMSGIDGSYSFIVKCGWAGNINIFKVGYNFSPPSIVITNPVTDELGYQNFIGTVSETTYTISGRLTDSRNLNGLDGAVVTFYDGLTVHEETTSGGGYYSYNVPSGWIGSVTPSYSGYSFDPTTSPVGPIQENITRDFSGTVVKPVISGTILDEDLQPILGVTVTASPGGTDTTSSDGSYSLEMLYGWSGYIKPSKPGWKFQPIKRNYSNVGSDMPAQLFIGTRLNSKVSISGNVTRADGSGIPGVSLTFSGITEPAVTDDLGFYSKLVVSGWSGTVTPVMSGYTFTPSSRVYTNVKGDTGQQDYVDFSSGLQPKIALSPGCLNFAADTGGNTGGAQTFLVNNSGGGTINWTVSADQTWIGYTPTAGANAGTVTVSVDPTGLEAGVYKGLVTIADANATNSPQTVRVQLAIKDPAKSEKPFGVFSTPLEGATVRSSVPFTGWALDDMGIESVKIYLEDGKKLKYIDDVVFVEGARPDVELLYPGYPCNNKAGWGYMMLTNFLPGGGNGPYTFHAVATDIEGNEVTLGTRTVTIDNANAVLPFGAIDTPEQGGLASGASFRNQGWVLTPMPNKIPEDGSTIFVYVDGAELGNPTYNVYREDIATLFPGYANSNGALAYFDFDTTQYESGIHTIYWSATDDASNTDGIGSRFFNIVNTGGNRCAAQSTTLYFDLETLNRLPQAKPESLAVRKGFSKEAQPVNAPRDNAGTPDINLKQSGRIEFKVSNRSTVIAGYRLVGDQLRKLPVGSTLKTGTGMFYWHAAPAFSGTFRLVFVLREPDGTIKRKDVTVNIDNGEEFVNIEKTGNPGSVN